jgi:hypothetical protein
MCCGVLGDALLLRLGPERAPTAISEDGLRVMDFTGRPMKAFALAESAFVASESALRRWVGEAVAFAGSLPEK